MHKFEDITIEIGLRFKNGRGKVEPMRFRGRVLDEAKEPYCDTEDGYAREMYWAIYQTDKGNYLVHWVNRSVYWHDPEISDYAVLGELPVYGQTFTGSVLGGPAWCLPYDLIDRVKAVLGKKEE